MKLDKVAAGYDRKIVVRDVSIDIKKGEIISLIGPNGAGKSTLLKSINKSLTPISGSVFIGGRDIKDVKVKDLARKMSIVTTDRIKPQLMTAYDVVMSGRIPYTDGFGIAREDDKIAAKKAIDVMKIEPFAHRSYMNLSDGQKQRTLIARAICQEPEYLVMDEPTSYMDIRHQMELMDVIGKLSEEGITVIMSLHELEHALQVSDRLLLVHEDGHVNCARPEEVIEKEMLKDLFSLDDVMYRKVIAGIVIKSTEIGGAGAQSEGHEKRERHSGFFINAACEYFPCHNLPEERFNCMFCYCPLYDAEDCGGQYFYNDKGIKNCRDCIYVHDRDNYPEIIKKIKERLYGTGKNGKV